MSVEATLLLVFVDLVGDLASQKVTDGSAEQLVLGGKFEIHEGSGYQRARHHQRRALAPMSPPPPNDAGNCTDHERGR